MHVNRLNNHHNDNDTEFLEPLNTFGYVCLGLNFLCISLNLSRLWHIITHVGPHYLEDLEHCFEFFMAACFCANQVKLLLIPMDCMMKVFTRNKVNWGTLAGLILFQILLDEHRRKIVTLFHVFVAIVSSGVIHLCRGVKSKTSREMA